MIHLTRFKKIISLAALVLVASTMTALGAATWQGPSAPPKDISGIEPILDFSDVVSKSKLRKQTLQGPVEVFNGGSYPARFGYVGGGLPYVQTADTPAWDGFEPAVAIGSDGKPIVAYRQTMPSGIAIVHCQNPSCTALDTPVTVGTATNLYKPEIAIGADGMAVIVFVDEILGLRLVRCQNVSCSSLDSAVTIDANFWAGWDVITSGGKPLIAYGRSGSLYTAYCNTVTCQTGVQITELYDIPIGQAAGISIQISGGLPAIVYVHDISGSFAIERARCNDSGCTSFAGNQTIISGIYLDTGSFSSALGSDGYSVITYADLTGADSIKFIKCTSVICDTSLAPVTIEAGVDYMANGETAVAIAPDGMPAIALWKQSIPDDAIFIKCSLLDCSDTSPTGNVRTVIGHGSNDENGRWNDLVYGNDGLPVLVYSESSLGKLKIAKFNNPLGDSSLLYGGAIGIGTVGVTQGSIPSGIPASTGLYGYAAGTGSYGIYAQASRGTAIGASVSKATDFAGNFLGNVTVANPASGPLKGKLNVQRSLTTLKTFTATNESAVTAQMDRTTLRVSSGVARGTVTGSSVANRAGVLAYSLTQPGLSVSISNDSIGASAASYYNYGVFGYSADGTGAVGAGDPTQANAQGVFGQSVDFGIYGYSDFDLTGYQYPGGGAIAAQKSGVGVYACGTTSAAEFNGDVRIIGSLGMGILSTTYVENPSGSGTIVGKLVTPQASMTQAMLEQVVAACLADSSNPSKCTSDPLVNL